MCGVFGVVDFNKNLDLNKLEKYTNSLFKRGPDHGDYRIWDIENSKIGLGHRRLSIVDLSENGNQPFVYDNLAMVYNGEVYNHKELRQELIEKGYDFKSSSDTEVVLKYIHCFGLEYALNKFNGMYAIGLYNFEECLLTIVRDRLGVKPLYYLFDDDKLVFSSEIKPILMAHGKLDIDKNSVAYYLKYGYVPSPNTLWEGVKKITKGSYIEIEIDTRVVNEVNYWDYASIVTNDKCFDREELDRLVNESVRLRCDADVEVGCFLSGGYDSSLTAAIMQKNSTAPIKTFTIGFAEAEFDESEYAQKVAEYIGSEHHHMVCTPGFVRKMITELPDVWDDPISDTSVFPTLLVSQLARQHVKVAMSSDGGDELFAGYNSYPESLYLSKILPLFPFRRSVAKFLRNIVSNPKWFFSNTSRKIRRGSRLLESSGPLEIKRSIQVVFDDDEINMLLDMDGEYGFSSKPCLGKVNNMLIDDIDHVHSDKLLPKVDRASMHSSLEAREPLLDINIVEYSAALKEEYKLNGKVKKYALKELAYEYIPKHLLERPKQGFSIPIKKWLSNDLSQLIDIYFSDEKLKHQLFNDKCIEQILIRYRNGESVNFNQVWNLLMFQVWYDKWSKYVR